MYFWINQYTIIFKCDWFLLQLFQPKVKFDFPPGGLCTFTEVWTSLAFWESCIWWTGLLLPFCWTGWLCCWAGCYFFFGCYWALPLSQPSEKLLPPPGAWWTLTEVVPSVCLEKSMMKLFLFLNFEIFKFDYKSIEEWWKYIVTRFSSILTKRIGWFFVHTFYESIFLSDCLTEPKQFLLITGVERRYQRTSTSGWLEGRKWNINRFGNSFRFFQSNMHWVVMLLLQRQPSHQMRHWIVSCLILSLLKNRVFPI